LKVFLSIGWGNNTDDMNMDNMSKRLNRTISHRQQGQSLVEFALILPLFVLIVIGVFDLGRAFFASITITNAAREGARYGTLHVNDPQGVCNATLNEASSSGITLPYNDVTITCSAQSICSSGATASPGCSRNQPLRVTVNYIFDELALGFFFPGGIGMSRHVEMLVP
jgi:Flp pilus assembly protein TadG